MSGCSPVCVRIRTGRQREMKTGARKVKGEKREKGEKG
jgi:hypothetical protein